MFQSRFSFASCQAVKSPDCYFNFNSALFGKVYKQSQPLSQSISLLSGYTGIKESVTSPPTEPKSDSYRVEDYSEPQSAQEHSVEVPQIHINEIEQTSNLKADSEEEEDVATETEMPSPHRHLRLSRSQSKTKDNASSKLKHKDDWSEITDPEERRRVQNRIAQRKFRDKVKEAKERQERDEQNQAHAASAYYTPDPRDMGTDEELSGLPWGSFSMRHVVSRGRARQEQSGRGSYREGNLSHFDERSYYEPVVEAVQAYDPRYVGYQEPEYYDEGEKLYYDYGSGSASGHGGSSV